MDIATATLILKLVELGMTYGPGIVINAIQAISAQKYALTIADVEELELKLKHPSEYMPRPVEGEVV